MNRDILYITFLLCLSSQLYAQVEGPTVQKLRILDESLKKLSDNLASKLDNLERRVASGIQSQDRQNAVMKRTLEDILNSVRGPAGSLSHGVPVPRSASNPPVMKDEKIFFEDNTGHTDSSKWKRSDFKTKLHRGSAYDYIKSEAKFDHVVSNNDTLVIQITAAVHKKERNAFLQVVIRSPVNLPTGHERMFIHKSWGDGSSNDGYVSFRRGPAAPGDDNRVNVPRSREWDSGPLTLTWILRSGGDVEVLEDGSTVTTGSIPIAYFRELYDFSLNFSTQFGVKLQSVLVTNSESLAASRRS